MIVSIQIHKLVIPLLNECLQEIVLAQRKNIGDNKDKNILSILEDVMGIFVKLDNKILINKNATQKRIKHKFKYHEATVLAMYINFWLPLFPTEKLERLYLQDIINQINKQQC